MVVVSFREIFVAVALAACMAPNVQAQQLRFDKLDASKIDDFAPLAELCQRQEDSARPRESRLMIGVGRADITPPVGVKLRGGPGRASERVLGPLYDMTRRAGRKIAGEALKAFEDIDTRARKARRVFADNRRFDRVYEELDTPSVTNRASPAATVMRSAA